PHSSSMLTLSLHDALPIYIKGLPFLWPALHCWPQWLTATAALLVIFFVADTIARSRGPAAETPATPFHCYGKWNFGALLALLLRSEEHTSELQSRGHLVCR